MKIKTIKETENMPYRASMRKSSEYDSWDRWDRYYGSIPYKLVDRYIESKTGKELDDVYSDFKSFLVRKHVSKNYHKVMTDYFWHEIDLRTNFSRGDFYVKNGLISRKPKKSWKTKDVVLYKDSPKRIVYHLNPKFSFLEPHLIKMFGYNIGKALITDGITQKDLSFSLMEKIFNNYCESNDIFEHVPYRTYGYVRWHMIWSRVDIYDESDIIVYKHGTTEYRRYRAEQKDATRIYYANQDAIRVHDFNRVETKCHFGHEIFIA